MFIKPSSKPRKWDDKEACHREALKYETRGAFQRGNVGAYNFARNKQWLDEICSHMKYKPWSGGHRKAKFIDPKKAKTPKKTRRGKWENKEACYRESLKYNTRTEFLKGSSKAYKVSFYRGWLDEWLPKRAKNPVA